MPFRMGLRPLRTAFQPFRSSLRKPVSRRWQSSTPESTPAPAKAESNNPFAWNSPVGPKTVHFWAPVMKWVLVAVSIADFTRPPESLSLVQSGALMATGGIWTRWCLIIKPKNYLLAAVNFFLFCANGVQVGRIIVYQRSIKGTGVVAETSEAAKSAV